MTSHSIALLNQQLFTQVINMTSSQERWVETKRQLDGLGLEHQRLDACDGRKLGFEGFDDRYDLKSWRRDHHRNPILSELGCYASHIKALQLFLGQDKEYGLILEDDLDYADDFAALLEGIITKADDWDVVMLYASHPGIRLKRFDVGDYTISKFTSRAGGACAYLVSKPAAKAILAHAFPAKRPYDWVYNEGHKMGLKIRLVRPQPVSLRHVPSTIEALRDKSGRDHWLGKHTDKPLAPRWRVPFMRFWDGIRRIAYVSFGG